MTSLTEYSHTTLSLCRSPRLQRRSQLSPALSLKMKTSHFSHSNLLTCEVQSRQVRTGLQVPRDRLRFVIQPIKPAGVAGVLRQQPSRDFRRGVAPPPLPPGDLWSNPASPVAHYSFAARLPAGRKTAAPFSQPSPARSSSWAPSVSSRERRRVAVGNPPEDQTCGRRRLAV